MSESIRVFVNAAGVEMPRGGTALDAVRLWQAAEAKAVTTGGRVITDSRGLPLDAGAVLPAGAILRTVPNRAAGSGDDDPAA
jgi:hypothetical protein